jgi:iron complex outermembrane receptor protein
MKSKVALGIFVFGIAGQLLATETPATGEIATLEEVVITAQKRTERLQDVPVSASVLSGDAVSQANATDISDINRLVPSVQLKGTFNGRVPLAMRGISTNANEGAIGLTSGVAILLDGVPVPSDSFAANNLDDVAQIEVLKGPQATLGGRTASAGVINIVTGSPTDSFQGNATLQATSDSERRGTLRFSGPMGGNAGFSLAAFSSHLIYPVTNDLTNRDSAANNYGLRGKLKFSIGENFDATLTGRYSHFKSRGENFVLQYITPGANLFPYVDGVGISQAIGYPGINIRYGNTHYSSPVDMAADFKDKDASLTLNFRAGDYTLTSITAYQQEKQFQSQDIFESNVFFFDVVTHGFAPHFGNVQTLDATVEQTSQEFRILSPTTGPVSFIAGAFYSSNKVDDIGLRVWVANPTSLHNVSKTTTTDVYGRVTSKVADNTSIVAGLRYNKDKIDWNKTQFFNPPAGQFQGCDTAAPGPPGSVSNPPPRNCTWNLSDSSSATVGDISLQQKFGADRMAYLTLARGYKPKAFNTVHDFASLQSGLNSTPAAFAADKLAAQAVDQEKINHVELGLKSSLLDGRMTFNAALFNTDYDGYQVQIFDTSAVNRSATTSQRQGAHARC